MLKAEKLKADINRYTKSDIMVAFSGGVDSSLVLKLACEGARINKKKVYAVTIHTELHPMNDMVIAEKVAKEAGAEHLIINLNELDNGEIINNPENRCYLCKKFIFAKLKKLAEHLDLKIILEGTNDDDFKAYRPGIKALKELGIISPLADSRMAKEDIRKMAAEYGISVATRPAAPCLATRFPYGTRLSFEKIKKVEEAEEYLKSLGAANVRVRVHGDIARIEVEQQEIEDLLKRRSDIVRRLKKIGYEYITLDLEGFRSGSMDYKINKK